MARMTERMKELFTNVKAVGVATADGEGFPNLIAVGTKKIIDDETILMSDQFFGKTIQNMKDNPRVAVSFWEGHEGYQLKGRVNIETTGTRFEETAKWIDEMSAQLGFPMRSKGAIVLHIEEIYGISPGPGAGKKLS